MAVWLHVPLDSSPIWQLEEHPVFTQKMSDDDDLAVSLSRYPSCDHSPETLVSKLAIPVVIDQPPDLQIVPLKIVV